MVIFTTKEKGFIRKAFRQTRKFFPDDPLDETIMESNLNDIVLALNYNHNHVGSLGRDGHETMWGIFNKLGFCKDGVTTFEERKKQIEEKKEKEIERRKKEQKKKEEELRKVIENAEEKLERIQKSDEEIEAEITEKELKAKQQLREEMTRLRKQKLREAEKDHKQFLETIQRDFLDVSGDIKDMEDEIEEFQESEEDDIEEETEPELELEPELEEEPPEPEPEETREDVKEGTEEEERTMNPFNHMNHDQMKNDYTVDELKDIADQLDVAYDEYILKDDLIEKVREA